MIRKILYILALMATPALAAETVYPYLMTQGHNRTKQVVRKGIPVQVQLPAGPTDWTFAKRESKNVILSATMDYPSPGRIDGTSKIQTFTFKIRTDLPSMIVLHTKNLPPVLKTIVPDGRYRVTLVPE